jgi:CRP-like cAMP-binding protein
MFDGLPPENTTVVAEDSEVLVLTQSRFHEIMRVYPQIGLNLLTIAAQLFRKMGSTV